MKKTIGMVVVAAFAGTAAVVPAATITATRRRTRSAKRADVGDQVGSGVAVQIGIGFIRQRSAAP